MTTLPQRLPDRGPDRRSEPRSPLETSALLRRLPGVRSFDLEVVGADLVTPAMRRLILTAPGLEDLEADAGQDLMLAVPADGSDHFRRRYTIRRLDRQAPSVTLDVVLHGDGPGARWAATAQPGDRVEALGPRGKVTVVRDAAWHLFAGDESFLPATLSMIESLPADSVAIAVLEVSGPEEEQRPDGAPAGTALHWLHRVAAPGTGRALADALAGLDLPDGAGHVYMGGELHQVAAARAVLVERGVDPTAVEHKAYWRLGVANAAHGEPARTDDSPVDPSGNRPG